MSDSGSVASSSTIPGRSKGKHSLKSLLKFGKGNSTKRKENTTSKTQLQLRPVEASTLQHPNSSSSAVVTEAPTPLPPILPHSETVVVTEHLSVLNSRASLETKPAPVQNASTPSAADSATPTETLSVPITSTLTLTSQVHEELCPIHELWNQAYDDLKAEESKLIADYEKLLCGDTLSTLSNAKAERQEQLETVLKKRVEEVKANAWKLKFGGKDIPVKDLAQPAVAVINWANNYVSTALALNPYASIAWSGVSLLLPAVSMAKGLSAISDLIVCSKLREDLYARQYESRSSDGHQKLFLESHTRYRDTLKQLYVQILKFQASSICYLFKNGAFRVGLDMIKWNDWESALSDIQEREVAFGKIYEVWKDFISQEESEALRTRHEDYLENMAIACHDLSGLRKAIENTRRDHKRQELLNWLSDVDPSVNYNTALEKHENHTGDWLLKDNKLFESWQSAPNSLLWLNGKAGSGKSALCASAVRKLRDTHDQNPEAAIAHFYFSFADSKKQNVVEMLCSVIKQLCCCRPDTPDSVASLLRYKEKGERPGREALEKILLATIHGFSSVYIVLDALDECPLGGNARSDLLSSLLRMRRSAPENLHFLFTSRREQDIEEKFKVFSSTPGCSLITDINLLLVQKAVEQDIERYIDQTFRETDPFYTWSADIQAEAKASLIKRADGMYANVQNCVCELELYSRLADA